MKVSIEGQCHFLTLFFPGFVCFVLILGLDIKTIGPLVTICKLQVWSTLYENGSVMTSLMISLSLSLSLSIRICDVVVKQ